MSLLYVGWWSSQSSFLCCRILYSKREVQRQNLPMTAGCFLQPGTGCTSNITYLCYRTALSSQSWPGLIMQSTVKTHSRSSKISQSKGTSDTMEAFMSLFFFSWKLRHTGRGKEYSPRSVGSVLYRYYSQFLMLEFTRTPSTQWNQGEIGLNWHLCSWSR